MKKQGASVVAVATVIGLTTLLATAQGVFAAQVSFPKLARGLNTWLVRAMDQCSSSTLSMVGQPHLPSGGCPQTNLVTEDTLGMNFVKLRVTARGSIGLFGTGFTLGDSLRVRLTLRVTRPGVQVKHPPGSNKRVTFQDTTVECPRAPDAFLARPNGAVVGRTDLGACLSPNTNLQTGNIEIIGVSLINAVNGKVVASPGVLRR